MFINQFNIINQLNSKIFNFKLKKNLKYHKKNFLDAQYNNID